MPTYVYLAACAVCATALIGCATCQSGRGDNRPVPFAHAEINVTRDEQGKPVTLKTQTDDPAEIRRIFSFFPGGGKGKWSLIAGGWKARITLRFTRPNGSIVEVFSDYRDWTEGKGDFRVRGDLAGYVRKLLDEKSKGHGD